MYLYGVSSHKLCVCFLCANGSTDCIVLSISVHYTASRALCSGPHQGLIIGTYCFFARHLAFRSQSRGYALTSKQAQLQYACGPLGQRQCIAILAGCLSFSFPTFQCAIIECTGTGIWPHLTLCSPK